MESLFDNNTKISVQKSKKGKQLVQDLISKMKSPEVQEPAPAVSANAQEPKKVETADIDKDKLQNELETIMRLLQYDDNEILKKRKYEIEKLLSVAQPLSKNLKIFKCSEFGNIKWDIDNKIVEFESQARYSEEEFLSTPKSAVSIINKLKTLFQVQLGNQYEDNCNEIQNS